jgi:uncharacterized protein
VAVSARGVADDAQIATEKPMNISLYDAVVRPYLQIMAGIDRCLDKGRAHCASIGRDVNELVERRIFSDMLPLHFQIVTLVHMSAGAITAAREGTFGAPDLTLAFDYDRLQGHLRSALAEIGRLDPVEVNRLAGGEVTFRAGDVTLPFSTADFFLSFAVPHFYFHSTTAYDVLRMEGVPLGKRDFLGTVRTRPIAS